MEIEYFNSDELEELNHQTHSMKTGIILIALLLGLNIYLWVWHTPASVENADAQWCEDNGGRWIDSYRNQHCEWVPK